MSRYKFITNKQRESLQTALEIIESIKQELDAELQPEFAPLSVSGQLLKKAIQYEQLLKGD